MRLTRTNDQSTLPTHIFLYSHLRTRSNLFMRLLQTHPMIKQKLYPFKDAYMNGPECQTSAKMKQGRAEGVGMKSLEEFEEAFRGVTFQKGLDDVEETIASAECEGKIAVIKEHTCFMLPREGKPRPIVVDRQLDKIDVNTGLGPGFYLESQQVKFPLPNPTLLPDRLVVSFTPVLMIRHPAYTFPSALRASSSYGAQVFDPDFSLVTTYQWQRMIFDFYCGYYKSEFESDLDEYRIEREHKNCCERPQIRRRRNWPIVVDGDSLLNDTEGQMTTFCEMVGMDASKIQYSWDPHYVKRNAVWDAFTKVAEESTGVIKSETIKPPNLAEEVKKWEKEWNTEVAEKLREYVELAMDDYDYLYIHSI